jgi:hypothetical protein
MKNTTPEKMLEIINKLSIGDMVNESLVADLTELANAWSQEQSYVNDCVNRLVSNPIAQISFEAVERLNRSDSMEYMVNTRDAHIDLFTIDQLDELTGLLYVDV